jgi:hypothetical protein
LITELRDEVRSHGAQFWVATLSTGIQVHPDRAVRQTFMKRLGLDSLSYPDDRIRSLAAREGIPVVSLAPVLLRYAESHGQPLHGFRNAVPGFGHWNEEGNRVAGEALAAELCRSLGQRATEAAHRR